jgi:hypothetical protein
MHQPSYTNFQRTELVESAHNPHIKAKAACIEVTPMHTTDHITAYVDALPERIMATAAVHPIVHMTIERDYVPLIASDLYRGQVITGSHQGDFANTFGAIMMDAAAQHPHITLDIHAPMARIMAIQLQLGAMARKRLH